MPCDPWRDQTSEHLVVAWCNFRASSTMAMDPEELVTLTNHGTMKLRSAVVRAMILSAKERERATIVREGKPAILNFKQIRNLRAKWDERRGSSTGGIAFMNDNESKDVFDLVEIVGKPLDNPLTTSRDP
jgi:hypothetical protein